MSSKKKPQKKQAIPKKEQPKTNSSSEKELSNKVVLILTFVLAIVYFIFSTFSDGFFMHDEVGNFINSRNLWYDDILKIIGANTKGGYRILYAIPALGRLYFYESI